MLQKRVEGLWDCAYCGTKGIKARYDTCQGCGKARGIDTVFYLPDDLEAATLTREEEAKTTNEPDWLCDYCDTYKGQIRMYVESAERKGSYQRIRMAL